MTTSTIHRKRLTVATFLLLLTISNWVTFRVTSRRTHKTASDQFTSGTPMRYMAKLNSPEKLPGIRASLNEVSASKLQDREREARSYFFNPQKADHPPKVAVLSTTGRVTTGAAEAFGLSQQERTDVQNAFNAIFAKAESDFVSRAVYDESASKPDSGIYVFDVPATQDRGASLLLELHQRLHELLGDSRTETLCRAIDPEQLRGGLGRSDMRCEIYTPESKVGGGGTVMHYQLSDAETGAVNTTAEMTLGAFKERFGDVFSFQAIE